MTGQYRLSEERIRKSLELIEYLIDNFKHPESKKIFTARYINKLSSDFSLYYSLEEPISYSLFDEKTGMLVSLKNYKSKLHIIFYGEETIYIPLPEELTEDFYFNDSINIDFHNVSLYYMKKAIQFYNIILRESYND